MSELRETAERVLRITIDLLEREGVPPTYDEIAAVYDRKQRAVVVQLDHLEELGYIRRAKGQYRSIRVLKTPNGKPYRPPGKPRQELRPRSRITIDATPYDEMPQLEPATVLGAVSAGPPSEAIEYSDVVVLPSLEKRPGEFRVWVRGDSMDGPPHYIRDGDVAVCRSGPATAGDIVIVRIGDEVTIKLLSRTNGHVELHPLNRDRKRFKPLRFASDHVGEGDDRQAVILGKVEYVIHRLG